MLGEFDLRDRMHEINLKAAQLAKEVAQQFSTKDRPRFVAGSMGPTTKLPSLGHIGFDDMVAAYEEQACSPDRRRRRCAADRDGAGLAASEDCNDWRTGGYAESRQAAARARCKSRCRNRGRCCWAPRSARR